ncbi:hypothetical protein D1816_02145 [Aquimarina sp. AD10]|uniref:Lipoprotein n=1 Tax=Aquimarina aggregata TaxID=1642818 RepID=A0A162DIW6_9FLAO|nr:MULTISPECIES: hypothetical protein [Aquimarina]AXT59195.1 hypothetical protein D1816_02145 [Aquimarina sp. AD10]KZS41078.1 hypothetical protein AWE51_23265 [Aquimarina aggregata]RKM92685.1 hypothetical protein D7033_20720 [Aquimarina sp. AD10]
MRKLILYITLFATISSCTQKGYEKNIAKDYYLKKIDFNGIQFVGKKTDSILENGIWETIVPDYVFAYGSNENMIIVKTHPNYYTNQWNVDTTKTDFYVIDLNKDEKNIYGPLLEYQFEEKMFDLNGDTIEFNHFFSEIKK